MISVRKDIESIFDVISNFCSADANVKLAFLSLWKLLPLWMNVLAKSQLYPFVIIWLTSQSQVNLALDIELRISGARLEIISLISAISSWSGYLACIETKVVKNAFCMFPKATPNAKSFSFCTCSVLFEWPKRPLQC